MSGTDSLARVKSVLSSPLEIFRSRGLEHHNLVTCYSYVPLDSLASCPFLRKAVDRLWRRGEFVGNFV